MLNIGIDSHQGLVYEGSGHYGRALWPAPVITPAKIVFESEGPLESAKSNDSVNSSCRFREDYYDPIARVRRGRFYFAEGVQQQPTKWTVQPHPALPSEYIKKDGNDLKKDLDTFRGNHVYLKYVKGRQEQPLVLLGVDERFTVWTIIDIEANSMGEDLVTLKARSSLGVLPLIEKNKIPEAFRAKVNESLNMLIDEVHRSAPVSVIDRARDAASQILIAHFELSGKDAKDLGILANRLMDEKKVIGASAAKIIARLHARAKPSEQERQEMRSIREQDAQLATQCIGTILCELGWADWA